MPLYEYECDACGGRFEVIQKFSEVSEQCRTCGKGPVRRLQSAPGIQFKGTGWYITDYAQKGKSGTSESGDAPKSDAKETKPAAESGSGDSAKPSTPAAASSTPAKTDATSKSS